MRRRIGAAIAIAVVVALVVLSVCRRDGSGRGTARETAALEPAASRQLASGSAKPRRGRPAPALERLTLRGIVVDRAAAPVADATVALAAPARTVRTGKDGRFELPGLLPGTYVIEARRGSSVAGPIGVELDPRTREVTLRLYEGFVLEVEVVAADVGRPIVGAEVEVSLLSMHAGAGRQRAVTGADGVAKLEGLTYIGHELRVAAPGFVDERRGPGPDLEERSPGIRRMRIALDRAGTEIAGKLVDERGAAIAEGTIEAVPYQGGEHSVDEAKLAARTGAADPHVALRSGLGARSGADGQFRVGLGQGTWVLVATASECEPTVSDPIFVESGAPRRRELTLVMSRGRTVRGVVVDGEDREVGPARVEARWLDGTRVLASTVSDAGGSFELRGLPPAPVELIARTSDARSTPTAFDLRAGDVDGAVLALELTGEITGRVVDHAGVAIADAVVTFLDERARAKPSVYPDVVVTDDEGRFRIAGLARRVTYFLSAARPLDGAFGQHAAAISAKAGEHVTIAIPAGGAIVGRIVGVADPRALTVRDQQTLRTVRPGGDGRFRLDRLPALRYTLRISGAGVADTYVHDVEVGHGRDTDVGEVAVRPGRRVAGVVVDTRGQLVDGATVRIEVDGKYAVLTRAAGGRFSLGVPQVPLVVVAMHPKAGRSAALALGPSANGSALRLAMLPGGTIRGTARAHGAGIADAPVTVWPAGPRPSEPVAATVTDDAGSFEIAAVPAGRWLVELGLPAFEHEHRVIQRGIELATGASIALEIDASAAPDGTIVQPKPELPELPTYGEESEGAH